MIGQLILLYPFHLSLLLLTVRYFKGKCKLNFGAYKSLSVILFIQSINRVLKEKILWHVGRGSWLTFGVILNKATSRKFWQIRAPNLLSVLSVHSFMSANINLVFEVPMVFQTENQGVCFFSNHQIENLVLSLR